MNTDVERIKARANVQEVVGRYVQLKKLGNLYRGLCPFHNEKTPSFVVTPERQIWHCFGCGEGGDVFTFLQRMEGWDFPETLEHLAKETGIELERARPAAATGEKEKLLKINEIAEKFWRAQLEVPGNVGAAYVAKRRISQLAADSFGIGYAPDSWEGLVNAMTRAGADLQLARQLGLVTLSAKNGKYFDRFRQRLMIPLRDQQGRTVAFTGRWLGPEDAQEGKYVNSPESPLFHKGSYLYALDAAKTPMRREGFAILAEGNLDVVTAHQFGTKNVVGVSGTACTPEHVALLKRFVQSVALCFDRDAAGMEAARKTACLAWEAGLDVKVVSWPLSAGKDPDEVINKNPAVWTEAVAKPQPAMDYFIAQFAAQHPPVTAEGKREFARASLDLARRLPSAVEREHYLEQIGSIVKMSRATLIEEARSLERHDRPDDRRAEPNNSRVEPVETRVVAISSAEEKELSRFLASLMAVPAARQALVDFDGDLREALPAPWNGLYAAVAAGYTGGTIDSLDTTIQSTYQTTWLASQVLLAETASELPALTHEIRLTAYRWLKKYFTRKKEELNAALRKAEADRDDAAIRDILLSIRQAQDRNESLRQLAS